MTIKNKVIGMFLVIIISIMATSTGRCMDTLLEEGKDEQKRYRRLNADQRAEVDEALLKDLTYDQKGFIDKVLGHYVCDLPAWKEELDKKDQFFDNDRFLNELYKAHDELIAVAEAEKIKHAPIMPELHKQYLEKFKEPLKDSAWTSSLINNVGWSGVRLWLTGHLREVLDDRDRRK